MTDYAGVKEWRARPEAKAMRAAQAGRYRAKHPAKAKAVKDAYRERSKDVRLPREASQATERRRRDPEGELRRRKAFEARKEAERERIAGRPRAFSCEICSQAGKTVFDHCHMTGQFRGWICDRCNKVLGMVGDSPRLLFQLQCYLQKEAYGQVESGDEKRPTIQ